MEKEKTLKEMREDYHDKNMWEDYHNRGIIGDKAYNLFKQKAGFE